MSDEQPAVEVPMPPPPAPEAVVPPAEVPPPPAPAEAESPQPEAAPAPPEAAAETPAGGETPPDGEAPAENGAVAAAPSNKKWYIVKVQSGREESIKEAIEKRVKIEGLEEFYGQIHIPTEKVVEMRSNKRVTRERKLYPGYLMVEVEYNDRILYLFRETSGVGDFVGGGVNKAPPPMSEREVAQMMGKRGEKQPKEAPVKLKFSLGDRVKINAGVFNGMEGEIKEILEAKGQVRVEVTIFGRPVSMELEYWQVDTV